jgi:hypothetical protein
VTLPQLHPGAVFPTPAKARRLRLRPILTVGPQPRQPRPKRESRMTISIRRRQVFSMIGAMIAAPRIGMAQAEACLRLAEGLSLCSTGEWTVRSTIDGATASLISQNGIKGAVTLSTGLTSEEVSGAQSMISDAPMHARAKVLMTGFVEIDGQFATTVAYLPRHASPAMVVAMSGVIGDDFTLVVTTHETGVQTYSPSHQLDHAALLAALRLEKDR